MANTNEGSSNGRSMWLIHFSASRVLLSIVCTMPARIPDQAVGIDMKEQRTLIGIMLISVSSVTRILLNFLNLNDIKSFVVVTCCANRANVGR